MEPLNTRGLSIGPSNSLSQTIRRHPLFFYFLIAFGFTWIYELIVYGILHLPLIPAGVPLVIIGPTAASFIMTSLTKRKPGALRLLRRFVRWRATSDLGGRWKAATPPCVKGSDETREIGKVNRPL